MAEQPPEPAGDTAWVLRGGRFDPDSVWRNDGRVSAAYGFHGLCVTVWHGDVVDDGAPHIRARSPQFRHAIVGELRAVGYDVIREPGHEWPSGLIWLPSRPMLADIDILRGVFEQREIRDNPNGFLKGGARHD